MDGERIRHYWSSEVKAILTTYTQFEKLIPAASGNGSAHNAEDGRFVEELLREYLKRFLPKGLEVLTGFILRPAVKTGINGRERKNEQDQHSTQIDIIIYDSENYPIFQRFGNAVIVPPEGVVAAISVKKHLRSVDIETECKKLLDIAKLCSCHFKESREEIIRGPYLALISMKTDLTDKSSVFSKIQELYGNQDNITFDSLVGFIGSLNDWGIFKRRPNNQNTKAKYLGFNYRENEEHLSLQFLLTGILSVFYDETRRNIRRPGYTSFESRRTQDEELGEISYQKIR